MSKDAYTLTNPEGKAIELPIHRGTMGPEVIDIGKLYRQQGVFTYDPGFVSTGSCDSEITKLPISFYMASSRLRRS
jgi:citrate synthase